jgi:peptide/nickel transport system ATP-binding protein
MVDRVLVMYAGRAVEKGSVEDVFYRARMPYSIGLLGSMPRIDAGEKTRLTPIKGSPPSLINPPPGCPFGPRCPLHYAKCDEAEPDLRKVDGANHTAACIRVEEIVETDVAAEDIFSQDSSDATLAAASEMGERSEDAPEIQVGTLAETIDMTSGATRADLAPPPFTDALDRPDPNEAAARREPEERA